MEHQLTYVEHSGKAVETDGRFEHVMAIALDPRSNWRQGAIRCVTKRQGDVAVKGFRDRSELHLAIGESLEKFTIGERLNIKNEAEILREVGGPDGDCIGLEDPDIWIDPQSGLMHLYFTLPFQNPETRKIFNISLGHAIGRDLQSLEMTTPALSMSKAAGGVAKELSIAPVNKQGVRLNLIESGAHAKSPKDGENWSYSTMRVAIAEDMGQPWQFGDTVFHPAEHNIAWIGGHASPGPLLPRDFMDVGEGKMLGIINGREANRRVGDGVVYGMFSVGLFIYDYENGKIEWVSPQPLIQDSQARTVTFASQFVPTEPGLGILYAHVDDSFVRAYTLNASGIRALLP